MNILRHLTWSLLLIISSCTAAPFSIEGKITDKTPGKDGYTATIVTGDQKTYQAVISRVRLQDAYQDLIVGQEVQVYGDTINLGSVTSITVSKIKIP